MPALKKIPFAADPKLPDCAPTVLKDQLGAQTLAERIQKFMQRGRRVFGRDLAVVAAVGWITLAPAAFAEPGILLANAGPADSASLATGEQLLLSSRSVNMNFAGRELKLAGFTGVVGYANELAYIVVLEGAASDGGARAEAGNILIIRPYGAPTAVEKFDAIRLTKQWSEAARRASPSAYASLERIKGGQERGVWFGRFGQTSYNVAASGSARYEHQTRTLMGDPAVRDIRFSGASDPHEVERLVAVTFLDALKAGDANTAAALIDPTPFGGRTLAGGAEDARLMAASAVIESRDWSQAAGDNPPQLSDGIWRAGNAAFQLRTMDDFVFVSRVSGEAK